MAGFGFLSIKMVSSSRGVAANSGAVRALATMVKRAAATSSTSVFKRPDESTASPIRLEVMNRIGNRLAAIADPL